MFVIITCLEHYNPTTYCKALVMLVVKFGYLLLHFKVISCNLFFNTKLKYSDVSSFCFFCEMNETCKMYCTGDLNVKSILKFKT